MTEAVPNAVSNDTAAALARTRYAEADHTHLTELLREREGIELKRHMVWRIFTKSCLPSPKQRRPLKHRVHRTVSIGLDIPDGKHGGKGTVGFSKYGLHAPFQVKDSEPATRPARGVRRLRRVRCRPVLLARP